MYLHAIEKADERLALPTSRSSGGRVGSGALIGHTAVRGSGRGVLAL